MNTRTSIISYAAWLLPLSLLSVHCGGDDLECGPGAKKYGDRCVAKVSDCAPGTDLIDGECRPQCAENESWSGTKCLPDTGCAPGTDLVDGTCVPACESGQYWDGQACAVIPECGDGTTFDEDAGACVPNNSLCAEGTHFESGACVPDTESCGPGTHLEGDACVPDILPEPDVSESTEPDGTAQVDLPDEGSTVTLGGIVDTPGDDDGDGYADPDYDRFGFTASAGTWLRIHATSEGATHPAFVLVSDDVDAGGVPLYARYGIAPNSLDAQREFYLPHDGDYTLLVSDYSHIAAELFGWLSVPVGGDEFGYFVSVENLGAPTPATVSSVPAAETGNMADGALSFVEIADLQQHDVRLIRSLGMPSGKMVSDVFAALMLFGPDGTKLRESLALSTDEDATLLFAATSAGTHLIVVDHLLSIGPQVDFEMRAQDVATIDCDTSDCSSGTVAEDTSQLLSWDVTTGTVWVAGGYVSDTADYRLEMQLMDEGLVPVGDPSTASKYGAGTLRHFAEADQRIYLLLQGDHGDEVPDYTLDARTVATDELTAGTTHTGLSVYEMPPDTYATAGLARISASAGQVILSQGFATTSTAWTDPVESYLTTGFETIAHPVDVTDASFPNSPLTPLIAFLPDGGPRLYEATDGSGADISGATYDTAFYAWTPTDLGTVAPGSPAVLADESLDADAGWGVYQFSGTGGQIVTVTVTPEASVQTQPEVWVATPGRHEYASGEHRWVSDATESAVGVLARGQAASAGDAASVEIELPYDGVEMVIVSDSGAGDPGDMFDIEVVAD